MQRWVKENEGRKKYAQVYMRISHILIPVLQFNEKIIHKIMSDRPYVEKSTVVP